MRVSAGHIAANALRVHQDTLGVSAHNTANMSTEGFRSQEMVISEAREGGVRGQIRERATPNATAVDADREFLLSNTDVGHETVTQVSAQRAFEASLAVFKTDDQMQRSLLDMKA